MVEFSATGYVFEKEVRQDPSWVKKTLQYWKDQLKQRPKDKSARREYAWFLQLAQTMGIATEELDLFRVRQLAGVEFSRPVLLRSQELVEHWFAAVARMWDSEGSAELPTWLQKPVMDALSVGFTAITVRNDLAIVRLKGNKILQGILIRSDGFVEDILTGARLESPEAVQEALGVVSGGPNGPNIVLR